MPDREICLCRELTKIHEEVIRGFAHEFTTGSRKGECVLIIGPGKEVSREQIEKGPKPNPLKNISIQLAEMWGINKRDAYNLLQSIKPGNQSKKSE